MKTRNLVVLLTSASLFIALVAAVAVLAGRERVVLRSPMLSQKPTIITYMEGEVEIASASSPDGPWIPANIGSRIREGDVIRTGTDGIADIRLYDDGIIRMAGDTQVTLDSLTIRRQTVDISRGVLFAKFRLLFDTQELRFTSPDAVAAVRGTELAFRVDERGTRIDALSGITEVSSLSYPDQRILLAFQKTTLVAPDTPPTDPVDLEPWRVAEHRQVFNGLHHEEVFLISQDILFSPNQAEILPESLDELDEVAALLTLRREDILIVGHTADVGGTAGQVRLSEERAASIRDELISRGIPPRRLSTIGYGGSRPVGDNGTEEGRAANRRVEFLVVE